MEKDHISYEIPDLENLYTALYNKSLNDEQKLAISVILTRPSPHVFWTPWYWQGK